MADELITALLRNAGVRVVVATTPELSRRARALHQLHPTSALVLAQALCGTALLAALQKEQTQVNLQLECDGPLRGLFVDATTDGKLRGYVKNPEVDFKGASPEFQWRPALGNKGFLSVLRDQGGGQFYRSSIELEHLDFPRDLEAYFNLSEQVASSVSMAVLELPGEPLGAVAGLLVQALPDADREAFAELKQSLGNGERFREALQAQPGASAAGLATAIFPGPQLEVVSRYPLSFTCRCSKDKVVNALQAMGVAELEDILRKERKAEATCQFCNTLYVVGEDELRSLLPPAKRLD